MPYATAIVLAGTAIYGAVEANERKQEAKRDIEALKKIQPKFKTGEQLYTEAENAVPFGYTPSERANFQQAMARRSNQARRIATDRNPNLAGAINAGINYGNIQGELGFAASDAALRRQKVMDYLNRSAAQSNAQTSADLISKREQEIAYGNAKNQANADIFNSLMQLGYAGASAAKTYNGTQTTDYGTGYVGGGGYESKPADQGIQSGRELTTQLEGPYGRQANPQYPNYQPAYDPYGMNVPPSQRFYNPYQDQKYIYTGY